MILPEWLRDIEARERVAAPNPELIRYEHGGGRAALLGDPRRGEERKLIADYYNEADREFYHNARRDVPRLQATVRALGEAMRELVTLKDDVKHADPEGYERRKPLAWQAARDALRLYQHGPEVDES